MTSNAQSPVPWAAIVPLESVDSSLVVGFSCGESTIDDWLHGPSRKDVKCGGCAVHVCIDAFGFPIAFFTLSATSIESVDVSQACRGGMHGAIPATLLGKMGVNSVYKGAGCGTHVLNHAMLFACNASQICASRLMVVDALNDGLVGWYERRGFKRLPGKPRRLVCKMSSIKARVQGMPKGYFVVAR